MPASQQASAILVLPAPFRIDVLGPLRVYDGAVNAEISAIKHRTVMAVLVVYANRVVSVDRLIEELWQDRAPATARKTVQGYIWRLRGALGTSGSHLLTEGSGYRIVVPSGGLDAITFELLVVDGARALKERRYEVAGQYLREAELLWRGPAFANVLRTPAIVAQVARLEEARLAADELRIEATLAIGGHSGAVPELTGLVIRFPARESMHRLLMIALHGSGRRADALSVFTRLRAVLVEEYGLEPDADTRQVHSRILNAG